MAKYEIEGICGHSYVKQLQGKMVKRMSYIEWASKLDCPDCYKKKRDAIFFADKTNYYELTGTEKQIIYANKIIIATKENLDSIVPTMADIRNIKLKTLNSEELNREEIRLNSCYEEWLELITDYNKFFNYINITFDKMISKNLNSKFWIENRGSICFDIYNSTEKRTMCVIKADDSYQRIIHLPFNI